MVLFFKKGNRNKLGNDGPVSPTLVAEKMLQNILRKGGLVIIWKGRDFGCAKSRAVCPI